jgi:hypothetical protein
VAGDAGGDEDCAARVGALQQRVERTDQPPVGRDIDRHDPLEDRGLDMADRGEGAEQTGISEQDIELAETLMERRAEAVDAGAVGDVERHQRGAVAAHFLDLVIDRFEPADGARNQHAMSALTGIGQGGRCAQPARSAGDQRNPALQAHGQTSSPVRRGRIEEGESPRSAAGKLQIMI